MYQKKGRTNIDIIYYVTLHYTRELPICGALIPNEPETPSKDIHHRLQLMLEFLKTYATTHNYSMYYAQRLGSAQEDTYNMEV